MPDRLEIVATFEKPVEARMALNVLNDAGIWAALSGEEMVGLIWHVSNAMNGIKLEVRTVDVERAISVLDGVLGKESARVVDEDELTRQALAESPEDESEANELNRPAPVPAQIPASTEPGDVPAVDRERYAWRAFLSAWLGFICFPLAWFSLYLLMQALIQPGELSRQGRIRLAIACLLVFASILTSYVLVKSFFAR